LRAGRSVERVSAPTTGTPAITTLGELRASGHVHRSVKTEIRENLIARLAAGEPTFPGIVGFDDTVLPEVERALLAGHDLVLLGERGQGKTRLIRTITGLLDEWTPVVEGCEINDHPYAPVCGRCLALLAGEGELTPVAWLHRSERYGEKLATPDTSVGDLIGDVDPIKVAQGRTLGDPETIHYGLVPRTNRGIIAVNELPDLAERIQVALLNVLEERDIQVRGYQLRMPLDLLLVASANPEDYTNRGRIITPLKDRFGAEVRTHYPLALDDELSLIAQEAAVLWSAEPAGPEQVGHATHAAPLVPAHVLEVVARFARDVRDAPQVDQRSGVSARFAIAAVETVAASAVRRAAITGEAMAVARVADLPSVVPASRGKVEFDDADEGREFEVLEHLLRRATAETFRAHLAGLDLRPLQQKFDEGLTVSTGDGVGADALLAQLGPVPVLSALLERLEPDGIGEGPAAVGIAAAVLEFAMEGLHLNKRLAKDSDGSRTVYGH
jgi:magnesium chelatase subunit I